ncbi:MAG: hypothetical protein LBD55_04725 [Treponema sp.]|jgi:hypothetical protein|nr:hypothetical protein [Treponema sp.]
MKNIFVYAVFACILIMSCSARVSGTLNSDGSADLSLQASLEPRMAALIRSISRLNAPPGGSEQILNGPAIAASMAAAPGIKSVSLHNSNPTTIEGTAGIVRADAFLAIPGTRGGGGFIGYEQTGAGGSFTITLNRNTGPRIIALLSPDVADYLSALMAPAVTGEALSKGEYLDLVRAVYGRGVAEEIAAGRVRVSINFPKPINTIKGGLVSGTAGNRGEFDIPLLDLLVLEHPLEYEVSWK